MKQTKQTKPIEIKQLNEAGTGLARIATLSAVDSDGDTYAPGAFGGEKGQTVKVLAAHDHRGVPLGKGRVFERGDEALAEFKLNLDTSTGSEWHSALKFDLDNPPATQEWSFGFRILDSAEEVREEEHVRVLKKLDVFEISPVVLGAGVNTRTLVAKDGEDKAVTPRHETPTSMGAWDGAANERRLEAGESLAKNGPRAYAWRDPDGDPEAKSSWGFPHHFVGEDGSPGAASTRAAIKGIAVLNGARGRTTIPEADRRGVWKHLAGHLRDADIEPPELRESGEGTGAKSLAELLIVRLGMRRASALFGPLVQDELSPDALEVAMKAAEMGVDPDGLLEAIRLEIEEHGPDNTEKYRRHLAMRGLHSV